MSRLRFGYFMAPFHAPGRNPTAALERDLDLVDHLDHLGYDEVWSASTIPPAARSSRRPR